ncbi:Uncharacterised protein [Klebsiella oxytoca]|nr:Uncharacterised protein [Klebsiella oxytoca]
MNSSVSSGSSRSSTFFQVDNELRRFTFQVFSVVLFREGHVDGELFASFVAFDTLFKTRDHAALAHRQDEVRGFAAFELFAVNGTSEVNGNAVFSINCAVFFFPVSLLLAQSIQHGINIGVGHFNNRFFNFDRFQTLQLNFRINFELYRVGEIFTQLVFARNIVSARRPD